MKRLPLPALTSNTKTPNTLYTVKTQNEAAAAPGQIKTQSNIDQKKTKEQCENNIYLFFCFCSQVHCLNPLKRCKLKIQNKTILLFRRWKYFLSLLSRAQKAHPTFAWLLFLSLL